jgi:epoxyqueuosine reductase QueG
LDALAAETARWIRERGFSALAIPASDIVDTTDRRGAVSHRAVGRLAGVGWVGKSLMLVNPDHGPRFRMTTVLGSMPLTPDAPLENRCGNCSLCTEACVAGAVKNKETDTFYNEPSEAVDLDRCMAVLEEFSARPEIGSLICGVCVKVCPYGKKQNTEIRTQNAEEIQRKS